jgi:hypothetical protein
MFAGMQLNLGRKKAIWIVAIVLVAGGMAAVVLVRRAGHMPATIILGAIISQSAQAEKEVPIAGAEVTARSGTVSATSKSDGSGFFKLVLPSGREDSDPITLECRHTGYQPVVLPIIGVGRLHVIRMVPTATQPTRLSAGPSVTVSNISVRYSAKTASAVNVGSTVKTFQAVNTGGVPCNRREPCSPDGKWKAAKASITLNAGQGNVFRNIRVSCIAGPCPFTELTPQSFPTQEESFEVTALNWSDTATFLVEAEVYRPLQNAAVHKSYPVIFGRVLDFTLPASAEGVCIEADLRGEHVIFPLGPSPDLSWASCTVANRQNKTKSFRCSLKEGYHF